MECTGTLKDVSRDWKSGKYIVSFVINEPVTGEMIESIQDSKLSIKATQYREKRSLNANSYFHVLVAKLADATRISKPRCKNKMLYRYGQPYLLDDGSEAVIKSNVPESEMLEQEMIHCWPCSVKGENGIEVTFYKVRRGSHTYDTREMSILIDGIVSECKEQGIETLTPAELARIKSMWGAE